MRLDAGRYFFSSSASRSVFSSRGVTMACLCSGSRHPSRNEALIMAVIYRTTTSNVFNRKVGIGLSGHDLVGDCMISLLTSTVLHCENWEYWHYRWMLLHEHPWLSCRNSTGKRQDHSSNQTWVSSSLLMEMASAKPHALQHTTTFCTWK